MRINKKINIHFFFRKPRLAGNFSIERTFDSFIPYINKKHFKINIINEVIYSSQEIKFAPHHFGQDRINNDVNKALDLINQISKNKK